MITDFYFWSINIRLWRERGCLDTSFDGAPSVIGGTACINFRLCNGALWGIIKDRQYSRLTLENLNNEIYPDANVAIEVQLVNGDRDILIAIDSEDPLGLTPKSSVMQPESGLRMEGEMCFVRLSKTEKVHYMCLYDGNFISIGNVEVRLNEANKFSEIITY